MLGVSSSGVSTAALCSCIVTRGEAGSISRGHTGRNVTYRRCLQKKKALRKREEEEAVDLSFLEAEAASAVAGASADHGSRAQRGAIAEAQQAKREQDAAAKQARRVEPPPRALHA